MTGQPARREDREPAHRGTAMPASSTTGVHAGRLRDSTGTVEIGLILIVGGFLMLGIAAVLVVLDALTLGAIAIGAGGVLIALGLWQAVR